MAAPKGNKYAIGNNGGQPPIFKNAKALSKAIDEYFVYIEGEFHEETIKQLDPKKKTYVDVKMLIWDRRPEPATVTGLALFLGFADRQSLYDYQAKQEYSGIIKRARLRVEMEYEKSLHSTSSSGAIFALKNMGWTDKTETDITTNGQSLIPNPDLSKLTDEEVRLMANITRKMNGA